MHIRRDKKFARQQQKKEKDIRLENGENLIEIREKYIVIKEDSTSKPLYLFRYENNDISDKYLCKNIYDEDISEQIEEDFYTSKIKCAKEFFSKELKKIVNDKQKELETIYNKITKKMIFVYQEMSDKFDINVAFETMNNRGLQLSNLEKLKNRLLYLLTLYDEKELPKSKKGLLNIVRNHFIECKAYKPNIIPTNLTSLYGGNQICKKI